MFYADHEKQIYLPPNGKRKLDPLAVHRALVVSTNGKIDDLLADWQGDDAVVKAKAEGLLVSGARVAFQCKPFDQPDGDTDGEVLETLVDYLEYMQGKGKRENTTPTSVFPQRRI